MPNSLKIKNCLVSGRVLNSREFVKGLLYTREEVDDWITGKGFPFGKYDPELGYIHRDRKCRNGVSDSSTIYTYDKDTWARHLINHAGTPCRVNTYGDSYTNCEQVNDGETWQEILAARIGEPIRNFGVSGYSVYQMYLRMLREEKSVPALYTIMNIYDDDHFRNLLGWQRLRFGLGKRHFHPPEPYVVANPSRRKFKEFKNPCPEPKDLYDFCNLDWTHEYLKGDFCMRVMLAKTNAQKGTAADSYRDIEDLAAEYGLTTVIESPKKLLETVNTLYIKSAIYASMLIVEKVEEFASKNGKKVLYLASYSTSSVGERVRPGRGTKVPEMLKPGNSYHPEFATFMRKTVARYVDLMDAHVKDFSERKVSVQNYLKIYYVAPNMFDTHYAPMGNNFTAFAAKDKLVEMLEPKPPSYERVLGAEQSNSCVALD